MNKKTSLLAQATSAVNYVFLDLNFFTNLSLFWLNLIVSLLIAEHSLRFFNK